MAADFTIIRIPHFIAVSPFNLTDPTGRPLYNVEHLVDGEGMVFAMICEGALPPPRCRSCGDGDDAMMLGHFCGYLFRERWNKTNNPDDAPGFDPVASVYGAGARDQLIGELTRGLTQRRNN